MIQSTRGLTLNELLKGGKMTNREKFKEVFGFVPNEDSTISVCPEEGYKCKDCFNCPFNTVWWETEYDKDFITKVK